MKETGEEKSIRESALGMTLIEVVFSLLLAGVVLGALGQGLVLGVRMNTDAKTRVGSLDLAKRVMEKLKSEVQYSQAVFDSAETNVNFSRTFYTDNDGVEVSSAEVGQRSLSRVTTNVANWLDSGGATLSATDANGVSHVLVKALTVRVLALHSAAALNATSNAGSPREVAMQVEIMRPSS